MLRRSPNHETLRLPMMMMIGINFVNETSLISSHINTFPPQNKRAALKGMLVTQNSQRKFPFIGSESFFSENIPQFPR